MADTDNKNIDFASASKAVERKESDNKKNDKKPHTKKSWLWWVGVIILILISITFILPATGISTLFMTSSIEFGRYNGEAITYENGSRMYNQYLNLYMQYGPYMDSTSLMMQAYYTAVVATALTQEAEKAGLYVSDLMVEQSILDSGYYNDASGNFDQAAYEATGASERVSIYTQVRENLPANTVLSDLTTVVSSQGEKDFVAAIANEGRTFDYVAFDYTVYPDELAAEYGASNPGPFTEIAVSSLSAASQDEANTLLAEAQADPSLFEEGESTTYFLSDLTTALGEANANLVFSTVEGQFAGPFQSGSSWLIYRIDSAASLPDFTVEETLDNVRSYISDNNPELITAWAEEAANIFYASAQEDFDEAVTENGLEDALHTVSATPASKGSSMFLNSFSSTDSYGMLSSAALASTDYNTQLFEAEDGAVLSPVASGNAYIVVRTGSYGETGTSSSFIDMFFDSIISMVTQDDTQNAILTSSKFEDNFLTILLRDALSN